MRPSDPQGRGLDQSGGETGSDHAGKFQQPRQRQRRRRGDRKTQLPETQQGGQGHIHHCLMSHGERVSPVIGWMSLGRMTVRKNWELTDGGVWKGLFLFIRIYTISPSDPRMEVILNLINIFQESLPLCL